METEWFVFSGESLLLITQDGGRHHIPRSAEPPTALKPWTRVLQLPNAPDGTERRTYRIETPHDVEEGVFVGLRESFGRLDSADYQAAGKARELLYWDMNTRYCGTCGAPMEQNTAISKVCTNCGREVWPQVAPAIIVRIRRRGDDGDERILMVHARNFRRKEMYGLVAGFVETGETLEECVEREVWEETHLRVKNIRYFGSQPWPYPSGVMIGFTADYAGGELELQEEELSRAGWFTRENLPPLPDKMSIARRLVDDFIMRNA